MFWKKKKLSNDDRHAALLQLIEILDQTLNKQREIKYVRSLMQTIVENHPAIDEVYSTVDLSALSLENLKDLSCILARIYDVHSIALFDDGLRAQFDRALREL